MQSSKILKKTVLDCCLPLPSVSSSLFYSKPFTNCLTLFQMFILHYQMLSTCIPCLKLLRGADSHTACDETIQPLCVPLSPVLLTATTAFKKKSTPTPPQCTDIEKNAQGARICWEEGKRSSSECVAKIEIKTRGRKVGRTGRENVAVGIRSCIVLVVCFSLVF